VCVDETLRFKFSDFLLDLSNGVTNRKYLTHDRDTLYAVCPYFKTPWFRRARGHHSAYYSMTVLLCDTTRSTSLSGGMLKVALYWRLRADVANQSLSFQRRYLNKQFVWIMQESSVVVRKRISLFRQLQKGSQLETQESRPYKLHRLLELWQEVSFQLSIHKLGIRHDTGCCCTD
jgi:hypothetical protein